MLLFQMLTNCVVKGSITSVDSDDEAFPTPKHLLFTAGGRISIISECDDSEQAKRFLGIQRNMNSVLKQHLGEVMRLAFSALVGIATLLIYFLYKAGESLTYEERLLRHLQSRLDLLMGISCSCFFSWAPTRLKLQISWLERVKHEG